MRSDLWTCRKCGRQFANMNQSHSCGQFTVEQFLASHGPEERKLFERFAVMTASCGEVSMAPARTRVGFQARMIFAAVNRLSTGRLDAHVILARRLDDPRFHRIEELGPRSYVHHFRIRAAAELDETVRAWLREAYEVGEQRHLSQDTQRSVTPDCEPAHRAWTMDIRASYDAAAASYAEHLFSELDGKPLDRHLLNRFAEAIRPDGLIADLGCGPGHVARYVAEQGRRVVGLDLSPGMVATAKQRSPGIAFHVGDLRRLDFGDNALAGIIAFYSIVHFDPAELTDVFREWRRVLEPDGLVLLAFHIGDEVMRVDDLWGTPVSLEFRFFEPGAVLAELNSAGLRALEVVEREPYAGVEYPSRRSYILAQA